MTSTSFIDDFSREVFEQTYKFGEETIDDTHERVAAELSKVEKDSEFWKEKFLYALRDFKFVPGGRITSNAGVGLKGTTYINCFVDGFTGEDQDSMESIMEALKRQALILKSEGGYGFCVDTLRPKGAFIHGIGNETPGAVRMLDMWDTQSAVITAGSGKKSSKKEAKQKIRKGAQMVTMSCWHPDIEEFITAKQTPGRLTKFNMSVLVNDKFMEAVEKDEDWNLIFPDFEKAKPDYKKHWKNANIDEWIKMGLPIKVHKIIKAQALWNLIMNSTYNRNEPGVLFIDTINKLNNLGYCEHINATNPCVTGDTIVDTDKGDIEIKELINRIKTGEIIKALSFNEKTGDLNYKEITFGDKTRENANIIEIEMENGMKLRLTPDHIVYTKNRGEVKASQLTDEDDIIIKTENMKAEELINCYSNLELEEKCKFDVLILKRIQHDLDETKMYDKISIEPIEGLNEVGTLKEHHKD